MSANNVDGILHILQGLVGLNAAAAGGFASALARQNQGFAMAPDMVRDILTRADLTGVSAKMYFPTLNAGTGGLTVSSGAVKLAGVFVDNAEASNAAWVQLFNATGPTLGTTVELFDLRVPAGAVGVFLFPHTPDFGTALSWAPTTAAHGNTENTTGKVTTAIVYLA